MADLKELREKIESLQKELSETKAEYYDACFSALGLKVNDEYDYMVGANLVNEIVQFAKDSIDKFHKENK